MTIVLLVVASLLIGGVLVIGAPVSGTQNDENDCGAGVEVRLQPASGVGGLTPSQLATAGAIIEEGNRLRIPPGGILVALAVANQESDFTNYASDGTGGGLLPNLAAIERSLSLPDEAVGTDRGSLGVFQQQWPRWGSMYELMAPTRKYLVPARALCWKCGSDVATGHTRHGKRVYVCRANKCISRKAEPVDQLIEAVVVARLSRSDAMGLLSRPDTPDLAVQQNKAQALRDRLDDLATGLEEGVLRLVSLRRSSDRLRAELAVVEAKMRDATHADVLTLLVTARDVAAAWDKCDLQQKRAVIEALMIVTLSAPKRGRLQFDAETVKIEWRSAHV